MNYENRDWEISLKDMVFSVLYQWKKLLLAACALAVCLGAFQGYRTVKANNAIPSDDQHSEEYVEALEKYEKEKYFKEVHISDLVEKLENQKIYLADSILMQLDTHSTYEAVASLLCTTDYQIMPDKVYQDKDYTSSIVSFYKSALANNTLYEEIADVLDTEIGYAKELISISAGEANMLNIAVWHSDKETASQIMDLILDYVAEYKLQADELFGEHSANVVLNTVSYYTSDYIGNRQATEYGRLLDLERQLYDSQNALDALVAPEENVQAPASVVAAAVKWAILGGVAGVALVAVVYCCYYIFGNAVYSGSELHSRLGVKILGAVVDRKKRYDPISAWLRSTEGRISENSDINMQLIAENIRYYSENANVLLVTGEVEEEKITRMVEELQKKLPDVKLVGCGSILRSPDSVRKVHECDGVMLVEKCGSSRYSNIVRELERVTDMGKSLVGCVVLD